MKDKTFYMVFLEGGFAPAYKHETIESAKQEAQRLSRLNRKKAWVLCTLVSYELLEFEVKDCRPDLDLPF